MQSPEKGNPGCGTGAGEMNEGIFNNTPIPPESQAFSDKTGPGVATAMSNKLTMLSVHLADLQQSGLTDETIRAAGLYTVPPDDIGKKLGGNDSGILSLLAFPYPGCEGHERFKCFYEEGKSGPKYDGLVKSPKSPPP